MKINPKEIRALIRSPAKNRYKYFIRHIADREEVWGPYNDGWALAGTGDNRTVFTVWPAEDYALLCAKGSWEGFLPESIPLDQFLNELMPTLQHDGLIIGIFPTPEDNGIILSFEELIEDINDELAKYEY